MKGGENHITACNPSGEIWRGLDVERGLFLSKFPKLKQGTFRGGLSGLTEKRKGFGQFHNFGY